MNESDWIKVLGLILSSGVISSIIVAMLGRRREEAETGKLTAEAKGETADAAATWVEVSLRLQDQREKDHERYERRLTETEVKWEKKYNELEIRLESELGILRAENKALKQERDELAEQVDELTQRLEVLENGGNGHGL